MVTISSLTEHLNHQGMVNTFSGVLNSTNKRFVSMSMENVQFPGPKWYKNNVAIHTYTQKEDISIAK